MLDELVLERIKLHDINTAFDAFHDCNCINVGRSVIESSTQPSIDNKEFESKKIEAVI
ncbi:hypothetical protein RCO48_21170 [Peribacillus frigoritolerans]|nr:hypothetical protein [Peribacillus frigoritolerans]